MGGFERAGAKTSEVTAPDRVFFRILAMCFMHKSRLQTLSDDRNDKHNVPTMLRAIILFISIVLGEHSHITSDVLGVFLTYLPTKIRFFTKGQVISKGFFGVFNFFQKTNEITSQKRINLFVFWKNSRLDNLLLKLTDL